MVSQKYITHSTRETQILAKNLAKSLKFPSFICLYGDLGSGKTTFVQGLALGLGIKKRIISPTFVFIRQYYLIKHLTRLAARQAFNNKQEFHAKQHRLSLRGEAEAISAISTEITAPLPSNGRGSARNDNDAKLIIKQQIRNLTFYHIDLYRLKTLNDIKALGIEEIIMDKDAIIAIEWPEKLKQIMPDHRIEIYLKYLDKDKREIKINY